MSTFLLMVIAYAVVGRTFGATDRDWSLYEMCKYHGGDYELRTSSQRGDICSFEFPIFTTEQEAKAFCDEVIPYHILESSTDGEFTRCKAEATLICASDWVQMYGRCYKMKKERMFYADAQTYCAGLKYPSSSKLIGAKIGFLHRIPLLRLLIDYFTHVHGFWLDASPVITEDLLYTEGPNMMVSVAGWPFRVKANSLIRVPETEKSMVLCEYTPPMNQAESNYLIRRYSEIYYPGVSTENGAFIRTASALLKNEADPMADSTYCLGVLRPFVTSAWAHSAVLSQAFRDELLKERSATIIRTSVHSQDAKRSIRDVPKCARNINKDFGVYFSQNGAKIFRKALGVWRTGKPEEVCDGGSWSTGFSLAREKQNSGLEDMSDARPAPIYCQARFGTPVYNPCPVGYSEYHRSNGQRWCHKFIPRRVIWEEAKNICKEDGEGFLSGWIDQTEMKFMNELADKGGVTDFGTDTNVWLGARRRSVCDVPGIYQRVGGFDFSDPHAECGRINVFQWEDGVAPNPPDFLPNWMTPYEPNNVWIKGERETCLVLLKGMVGNWGADRDGTHKINDVGCKNGESHYVMCGREASWDLQEVPV